MNGRTGIRAAGGRSFFEIEPINPDLHGEITCTLIQHYWKAYVLSFVYLLIYRQS